MRLPAKPSQPQRGSLATAVFLVGFMGAGKTSVGRALGKRLNWTFEDLDDRVESQKGRKIAEIFRESGEAEFRRAEHQALRQIIEELNRGGTKIVALGGGAFVRKENAELLKASRMPVIFLNAPVADLWDRCSKQASEMGWKRPLLRSPQEFRDLYQNRRKSYMKASLQIETGKRTVDEVAAEISEVLGLRRMEIRSEEGEVE